MANCHTLFIDFDECVTLTDTRKKSLKRSRKSIRDRIRNYFKEKKPNETIPKFYSQGSFEMNIGVNPIGRKKIVDGVEKTLFKYDVDDGAYFIDKEDRRRKIQAYHDWIYEAVDGYTDEDPIDKNTCVRVLFHDGHNIDLPIYFMDKEEVDAIPELAHKIDGWVESDPRAFVKWFNGKAKENPQLCRIVRYLKAWCDYQNFEEGFNKMPSGLVMTIWAANNAVFTSDRDDITLRDTLQAIKNKVDVDATYKCERPTVKKGEDLLKNYSYKAFFKDQLGEFLKSAQQACNESNQKEACYKWQKHLGSRFPCHLAEDKDENASSFVTPVIVRNNSKSA